METKTLIEAKKNINIEYYNNTNKIKCVSFLDENNELHRDGLPAKFYYDLEGNKEMILYYNHGRLHREGDAPAFIFLKGNRWQHWIYWKNGFIHRDNDQPAEYEIYSKEIILNYYKMNKNYKRVIIPNDGNIK